MNNLKITMFMAICIIKTHSASGIQRVIFTPFKSQKLSTVNTRMMEVKEEDIRVSLDPSGESSSIQRDKIKVKHSTLTEVRRSISHSG